MHDAHSGALLVDLGLHETGASGVAFSPDGRAVASLSYDDELRLSNASDGTPIWVGPPSTGRANSLGGLAFSPDSARLAAPWGEGARVLDGASGAVLARLSAQGERLLSVVFTPDGAAVVGSSAEGSVYFWRAADGELLGRERVHGGRADRLCVSPDGSRVVSAAHELVIWDVSTRRPLLSWRPHLTGIYDVRFSPDGNTLASLGRALAVQPAVGERPRCLPAAPLTCKPRPQPADPLSMRCFGVRPGVAWSAAPAASGRDAALACLAHGSLAALANMLAPFEKQLLQLSG